MEEQREIIEQRLGAFQFDEEGAVDRFCTRLARENGWTSEHAARVLEEYRRFVLLAVTAPHPVTPSDAVDQVWHLHLTYSDSYWNHFCPEVLGQTLHHHPSNGAAGARQRYKAWGARRFRSLPSLVMSESAPITATAGCSIVSLGSQALPAGAQQASGATGFQPLARLGLSCRAGSTLARGPSRSLTIVP